MTGVFAPYLKLAASGAPLAEADMGRAMTLLLEGAASEAEAAGFLMALKVRGETVDEIVAAARVMREMALRVAAPAEAVDTCGSGGDGAETFNISTAAAIVAAGAGVPVAKHGNRAASSKSGSSDVLTALGVNIHAAPSTIEKAIADAGIGFLFAAAHHRAVANVASVRRALGVRTLFNLLGPLTNPAGARRQLMGVYDAALGPPLAGALMRLGAERAWVVTGADGLDELTTTAESHVAALENGIVRTFTLDARDVGLARAKIGDLRGGSPNESADIIRSVLAGAPGPARDIVALNAGAAILVGGAECRLEQAVRRAEAAIDSGRASATLSRLVEITSEAAP